MITQKNLKSQETNKEKLFKFLFRDKNFRLNQIQIQKQNGTWTKWSREYLLSHIGDPSRIQFNNSKFINYIIIDCDHDDLYRWDDYSLPIPSFTIKNKTNNRHHHFYALKDPIPLASYATSETLSLLRDVRNGLNYYLKGDPCYTGQIAKNPFHDDHEVIVWCVDIPQYTLNDFTPYITRNETENFVISKNGTMYNGRNHAIFERTRRYAYKCHYSSYSQLYALIRAKAIHHNNEIDNPLSQNEIETIAKSITKWTFSHKDKIPKRKSQEEIKISRSKGQKERRDKERKIHMEKVRLRHRRECVVLFNQKIFYQLLSNVLKHSQNSIDKKHYQVSSSGGARWRPLSLDSFSQSPELALVVPLRVYDG